MRTMYNKTDNFDLRVGMTVFTASGEATGTVVDIAGFGSARVLDGLENSDTEHTTRANLGTGHFGVKRIVGPPTGFADVRYKFRDIGAVVANHGVVLVETAAGRPVESLVPPPTKSAAGWKGLRSRLWRQNVAPAG